MEHSTKKIPLAVMLFVLFFTGFLAFQIFFDVMTVEGTIETTEDTHIRYEERLKNTDFYNLKNERYKYADITAPVIVLNFWASWCVPCLAEFPSLVELRERYTTDKILILGINSGDDSLKGIKKVVKKYKLNFPIIPNENGELSQDFQVTSLPFSIIFHRGKVVEVSKGSQDFVSGEMIEKLNTLLAI